MEPTRQLILKKPGDLAVHPKVALTPELTEDAPEWAAILGMTQDRGEILTPLFITPEDEVLDGRHRLKAARACKLKAVPCLVIEDEDDQARIILDSICARRHYTKSARAYLALPLIEEAVTDGYRRKLNNLKQGDNSPKPNSVGFRDKNGSDELALKLGINPEYIRLAKNTARLFKDCDRVLERWLAAHPRDAGLWAAAEAEGRAWNVWRAARLVDMGEKPEDPSTVELIPEDLRAVYEAALFEGDMGLGAINKAIGGALATKGKPRADLDGADGAQVVYSLTNKFKQWRQQLWKNWDAVDTPQRVRVYQDLAQTVQAWPDDVRRVVAQNLNAGGKGK